MTIHPTTGRLVTLRQHICHAVPGPEDSWLLLAHAARGPGQPLTPADVVEAELFVTRGPGLPLIGRAELDVEELLLAQPVCDAHWPLTAPGYNFRHVLQPWQYWPLRPPGGYQFRLTLADGPATWLSFPLPSRK